MPRRLAVALIALLLPALAAAEEKKAAKKPTGTYSREAGDRKLAFAFKADTLTISLTAGETKMTIEADYGVTKEGVLYGVMTKVEKKGTDAGPSKGDLFSFQFDVSGSELTISDLKGTHVNDESRKIVEGVYKKE
jgi:hypothetical protein